MHVVLVGFGLGFFVALQLGPMSLFLIRSTLRRGWAVGLAIGAGVAVIDAAYATLGAAGAVPLLTIGPLRVVLGLAGGAVLVVLGARTLWSAFRVRTGGELDYEVSG
ncbi:MAG TPA: LysE family transporter, partial [Gaiellales bacterium]|nr:LysE family transporter [Gaiellales bacterium]